MYLTGTVTGAKAVPIALVLPGTFLDIMAGAMAGVAGAEVRVAAPAEEFSFELTQEDLEAAKLLEEDVAEPVLATIGGSRSDGPQAPPPPPKQPTPIGPAASRARFAPLPDPDAPATRSGIDLLAGLQMNVSVELGRTELTVAEVLGLGPGSVIELDRLAGEPVDILVNDRLIARGEVVVVDENFGVRVVEVIRRGADAEERAG
jgi:flagellar motor switch protein FliN/FliY